MCDRLRAAVTARATEALLRLADALLSRYDAAKRARAVLDYDDLIERTRVLLEQDGVAAWVLFKLDGGIEHILVDEAQDTNPEQWRIVQALAAEFFAGEGARSDNRTIFVVGDEKQSIFSFQGADPAALGRLKRHFSDRLEGVEKVLEPVDLKTSFRSTEPVLTLVDAVFANPAARDGVLSDPDDDDPSRPSSHRPCRAGRALGADCAPVEAEATAEPWTLPIDVSETDEPEARLADRIAATIEGWLARSDMLAAEGRPITAGDIMILVRRRTRFVGPVVRALKARGVPVAGVDRLALTEPLAVQDLMALGRFLLLPEDDLTLAGLLKSPLIGLDEDRLFTLAYGRKGSLWSSLIAAAEADAAGFEPARAWLAAMLAKVDYLRPFELFGGVLATPCPGDSGPGGSGRRALWRRLGPDALDPLDEFLSATLDYEQRHPPTLEGFVGWLDASEAEIKRELATRGDAVRIVTVHGAKGLESPIVFLPDTMQAPRANSGPQLLWTESDHDGRRIPYWSPRAEHRPNYCGALGDTARRKVDQEYRRLLYVALTRARDRLYVAGWHGKRERRRRKLARAGRNRHAHGRGRRDRTGWAHVAAHRSAADRPRQTAVGDHRWRPDHRIAGLGAPSRSGRAQTIPALGAIAAGSAGRSRRTGGPLALVGRGGAPLSPGSGDASAAADTARYWPRRSRTRGRSPAGRFCAGRTAAHGRRGVGRHRRSGLRRVFRTVLAGRGADRGPDRHAGHRRPDRPAAGRTGPRHNFRFQKRPRAVVRVGARAARLSGADGRLSRRAAPNLSRPRDRTGAGLDRWPAGGSVGAGTARSVRGIPTRRPGCLTPGRAPPYLIAIAREFIAGTTAVTDASFEADVLKSDLPVLVDFWAEWCAPCRAIAPILEDVARDKGDKLTVAKLNIDDNPGVPTKYGVRGIPTLMLFKGGQLAATKIGALPKGALYEWIDSVL